MSRVGGREDRNREEQQGWEQMLELGHWGESLEIEPDAEAHVDVVGNGMRLTDERHGEIHRSLHVLVELDARSDASAGEVKGVELRGQRVVHKHAASLVETVEAPVIRTVLGTGPDERGAAQFKAADDAAVSQLGSFEITAHGAQTTNGNLLSIDERVAGGLALDVKRMFQRRV